MLNIPRVLNNALDKEASPKRVQRRLLSQDSEPLPKDSQKKERLSSPESWQQVVGPSLQMECNPRFCLAIFLGPQPDG